MQEFRFEPFGMYRAMNGASLSFCDGSSHAREVLDFHYFDGVPEGRYCIAISIGFNGERELRTLTKKDAYRHLKIKVPITPTPFDPAKLSEGWLVKTDDGLEVTQLTVFDVDAPYTVFGVVNGRLGYWDIKGAWYCSNVPQSLVMYPPA